MYKCSNTEVRIVLCFECATLSTHGPSPSICLTPQCQIMQKLVPFFSSMAVAFPLKEVANEEEEDVRGGQVVRRGWWGAGGGRF